MRIDLINPHRIFFTAIATGIFMLVFTVLGYGFTVVDTLFIPGCTYFVLSLVDWHIERLKK